MIYTTFHNQDKSNLGHDSPAVISHLFTHLPEVRFWSLPVFCRTNSIQTPLCSYL